MPTNDNDPSIQQPILSSPDAHGMAALLLVESLVHGLCESATLSPRQAFEIAQRAVDVQIDQVDAAGGDGEAAAMRRSHALLLSIAATLGIDGDWVEAPSQPFD